jgi:hypothetical protein
MTNYGYAKIIGKIVSILWQYGTVDGGQPAVSGLRKSLILALYVTHLYLEILV